MFKRIRRESGFTLIELLVVLAILAILIAVVVPNLAGITGGARATAAEAELDTVQSAMDSMMSKYQAVSATSVISPTTGVKIALGDTIVMTYIKSYNPEGGSTTYGTVTPTWLLRSTTHGKYTWDVPGKVSQTEYD